MKKWRYLGVYGPELMICVGAVRLGPARQAFWAVWDRGNGRLHERTALGRGNVKMSAGHVHVREPDLQLELDFAETPGIETVCPSGPAYGWTRKQIVEVRGRLLLAGQSHAVSGPAIIDDTSAYYERHTRWHWSAGVGVTHDGRATAWNLVTGVNDPPHESERTIWVDGVPHEPGPATFAPDLTQVATPDGTLTFIPEATRHADENKLIVRSRYRQPFGIFAGSLGPGLDLQTGYGVMEDHDAYW